MIPVVLGGRHAISYKIGAFFLPFLVFAVPATEQHLTRGLFLRWCSVSVLSLTIAAASLVALDKTLLKGRSEKPISNNAVFAIGIFLGALRGAGTYLLARYAFHIPSETPENGLIRIFNSSVLGGVSFPLIALISFSHYEIGRIKAESRSQLSGIDQLLSASKDQKSQEAIFDAVAARLEGTRRDLIELSEASSALDSRLVADHLRVLSTDLIRPLSHQVERTRRSIWRMIRDSFSTILLIPDAITRQMPWFILLYSLGDIRVDLRLFGLGRGLALIACNLALFIALIQLLAALFKSMKPHYRNVILLPVLIAAMNSAGQILTHRLVHAEVTSPNLAVSFFWSLFLIYVISFAGAYVVLSIESISESEHEYLLMFQRVTSQVNSARSLTEQVARYLHGNLQTKINTSAFRINSASSEEQIREELKIAAEYMRLPISVPVDSVNMNIEAKLNEIKETWSPLIDLRLALTGDKSLVKVQEAVQLYDLVNEILSNAHRHGEASVVDLNIETNPRSIHIQASNNGSPVGEMKQGLGSKIYDSATHRDWQLLSTNGSVTFVGDIPLQHKEN